jgi:hypothetical protein
MSSAFITSAHISSLTAELIQAGTLTAIPVETGSTGQRVVMNPTTEQMEFFDDADNQIVTIGAQVDGADIVAIRAGSLMYDLIPIAAASSHNVAVSAQSATYKAVAASNTSNTIPTVEVKNWATTAGGPVLSLQAPSSTARPLGWGAGGSWGPALTPVDGNIVIDRSHQRLFLGSVIGGWHEFMLGDGGLQAPTGFVRFSNGFQICWGVDTRVASSGFYLAYANTFTSLYAITCVTSNGTTSAVSAFFSGSQVHVPIPSNSVWTTNYIAIGYAA